MKKCEWCVGYVIKGVDDVKSGQCEGMRGGCVKSGQCDEGGWMM